MTTRMDHLVIAAANLEQGIDYVKNELGIELPYGGAHMKMGTHNHLMQLGNNTFLEIISINDEMESPNRPRWFGLDDALIRQRINKEPALLTWIVNTNNLKNLIQKASFAAGNAELFTRGELSWYFGLPEDGGLLAGGMLPYAIEWQIEPHPASNMADLGCTLSQLEIYHPYSKWLSDKLDSIGALELVEVKQLPKNTSPYLVAHISTPLGIKKLTSHLTI